MKVKEGFENDVGICPDCLGRMNCEAGICYCYHCCIKYKWEGCYYEYIGVIDNCW